MGDPEELELMRVLVLVLVVVAGGWWLSRRPAVQLWWLRHVGARRAWLSRVLGSTPTFGAIQRAALAEALHHRTISVTGAVWLPASLEIDLAPADQEVIAHAPGPFLEDLSVVLANLAERHGWRLDGSISLRFAAQRSAAPGLPIVSVVALSTEGPTVSPPPPMSEGHQPGTATSSGPSTASSAPPPPDPGTWSSGPSPLPLTVPFGATAADPAGTVADPGAAASTGGGRDLVLDPEQDGGVPIAVSGSTAGAVIGRGGAADIIVAEPTVSAQHCRLVRTGSGWSIEDLGSSNGTVVNGEVLTRPHELAAGDVVGLGRQIRYRVRL
jgi:hypothetical protein